MGGAGIGNEASRKSGAAVERTKGLWQARAPAQPRVGGRGGAQPTVGQEGAAPAVENTYGRITHQRAGAQPLPRLPSSLWPQMQPARHPRTPSTALMVAPMSSSSVSPPISKIMMPHE